MNIIVAAAVGAVGRVRRGRVGIGGVAHGGRGGVGGRTRGLGVDVKYPVVLQNEVLDQAGLLAHVDLRRVCEDADPMNRLTDFKPWK